MIGEAERRDRFGYALQQALNVRGLSERQLAQQLGVDPRKVARWRTGKGLPDLYETQALISILQVDEDLFRNPPEVPRPPAYPIDRYLLENVDQEIDAAVDEALDQPLGDEATDGPRPSPAEQR